MREEVRGVTLTTAAAFVLAQTLASAGGSMIGLAWSYRNRKLFIKGILLACIGIGIAAAQVVVAIETNHAP